MMKHETTIHATVGELLDGYRPDAMRCWGGRLNLRPSYKRRLVPSEADKTRLVETVLHGGELKGVCWASCGDGSFELLDGQQRILTLLEFASGRGSFKAPDVCNSGAKRKFADMTEESQNRILNHPLRVHIYEGEAAMRPRMAKLLNSPSWSMNAQEAHNLNFPSPWLDDARRRFAEPGETMSKARKLLSIIDGDSTPSGLNRDYALHFALKWQAGKEKKNIAEYLCDKLASGETDASDLWEFFRGVVEWAYRLFGSLPEEAVRNEKMAHQWGSLWRQWKDAELDPEAIRAKVMEKVADERVDYHQTLVLYALTGEEKWLNDRNFPTAMKRTRYEQQGRKCAGKRCGGAELAFKDAQAHHVKPWSKGGRTDFANLSILCRTCNASESND